MPARRLPFEHMSGYSGTPLPRKLGIKPGHRLLVLGAPEGFGDSLGELPDGVTVRRRAAGTADVIVAFHDRRVHDRPHLERAAARDPPRGPGVASVTCACSA